MSQSEIGFILGIVVIAIIVNVYLIKAIRKLVNRVESLERFESTSKRIWRYQESAPEGFTWDERKEITTLVKKNIQAYERDTNRRLLMLESKKIDFNSVITYTIDTSVRSDMYNPCITLDTITVLIKDEDAPNIILDGVLFSEVGPKENSVFMGGTLYRACLRSELSKNIKAKLEMAVENNAINN